MSPNRECKGKMKESQNILERKDGERFPQESNFPRDTSSAPAPSDAKNVKRTAKQDAFRHEFSRGKLRHGKDRFHENPIGIGCWRWFCDELCHPTTKAVPHSKEEASDTAPYIFHTAQDNVGRGPCADSFGHNGICDTPGMALLKKGAKAILEVARHRPTLGKSGFKKLRAGLKLVHSRIGVSRGRWREHLKRNIPEELGDDALSVHLENSRHR